MFQTSIITDEVSQDLKQAIELAKKFSLDAVELRTVNEKSAFRFTDEDIYLIKQQLDEANLKVSAISSPFFKCDMDNKTEIKEHIKGLENCIHVAHKLNTNIIRGFAFWKKSKIDDCLERIAELYQKPIEMLKENGMIMALESDPSVNSTNAYELSKVIEKINSPHVKALWDPGNNLYSENFETPYPDGYNIIKKHMVHVHLKDAVINQNNEVIGCCFGEGMVDFKGQLKSLVEDNYNGYVVMEPHYRINSVLSNEILKCPGGSNFSEGGYEPSQKFLESFYEMMKEL